MPTPHRSIEAEGGLAVHIGQERYDFLVSNREQIRKHIINVEALAREWGVHKGTIWRWLKIVDQEQAKEKTNGN